MEPHRKPNQHFNQIAGRAGKDSSGHSTLGVEHSAEGLPEARKLTPKHGPLFLKWANIFKSFVGCSVLTLPYYNLLVP